MRSALPHMHFPALRPTPIPRARAFPSIVSISKSTKNVEARMPSRGHHLQSERQPVGGNCQLVTRQFISRVHKEPQKLNSKNPLKHPIGKGACELHRQQTWWKVCNRGSAPIPDSPWTDGTAHHQRLTVTTEGHTQKQTAQLLPYLNWYIWNKVHFYNSNSIL